MSAAVQAFWGEQVITARSTVSKVVEMAAIPLAATSAASAFSSAAVSREAQ